MPERTFRNFYAGRRYSRALSPSRLSSDPHQPPSPLGSPNSSSSSTASSSLDAVEAAAAHSRLRGFHDDPSVFYGAAAGAVPPPSWGAPPPMIPPAVPMSPVLPPHPVHRARMMR